MHAPHGTYNLFMGRSSKEQGYQWQIPLSPGENRAVGQAGDGDKCGTRGEA